MSNKIFNNVKLNLTLKPQTTRANLLSTSEDIAVQMGKIQKWYTDFAWSAFTAPTVTVSGSGNAVTSASFNTTSGLLTLTKGTTFLTSSTQYISSIESSGSGNAITALSVSNGKLTYTKGSTFSLSTHTHDDYLGAVKIGQYWGMTFPDGTATGTSWIRTTRSGIIPYAANTDATDGNVSSLGTSTWTFNNGYINNIYYKDLKTITVVAGNTADNSIDKMAGSYFFSGNNLIGGVNDWVGIQAGYSVDKWQIIGDGTYLLFRQNDYGGTNTTNWNDWRALLVPDKVTGSDGITVTKSTKTFGSDDTAVTVDTGVTIAHSNSVTAQTDYNKPYVKYDNQGHITASDYYVHTAIGTNNVAGWVKIATMKHIAIYDATPIMLTLSQRGNTITYRLHIQFSNSGGTIDPALGKFILSSDEAWQSITPRAYIIKSATSTWDLYILKLDTYEAIVVSSFDVGKHFTDRMTWTWTDVQTDESAIADGTEATKKVYSTTDHTHNYAGSSSAGGAATSAAKLNTDAGSATQPIYFSNGIPVVTTAPQSGAWFSSFTGSITSSGVMDVGRYINFHSTNAGTTDYDIRLDGAGTSSLVLTSNSNNPIFNIKGTLPILRFEQTASTATYYTQMIPETLTASRSITIPDYTGHLMVTGPGTQLVSGNDVNDGTFADINKHFYASTAAVSASLTNSPYITSGFQLFNIPTSTTSNYIKQFLIPNTSTICHMWRWRLNGSWSGGWRSPGTGFFSVIGTQSESTAEWTGYLPLPALYNGLTIAYYLPYASVTSTNVTLNLSLSNGTTTGAINCYQNNTTRLTTQYGAGSTIILTYWSAGSISVSGTATTDNRWTRCDYNTNTNTNVTQNVTTANTNYPLILSAYNTSVTTTTATTVNRAIGIYANASTGAITTMLASGAPSFVAKRSDTNATVSLMVGSTGVNHGVYSNSNENWIISQANGTKVTSIYTDLYNTSDGSTLLPIPFFDIISSSGVKGIRHNGDFSHIFKPGTTSELGYSGLVLGNNITSGSADNKYGLLRLYNANVRYTDISANTSNTANTTLTVPNKSGTIACTDDFDGIFYGTCATAADTAAKVVTVSNTNFKLVTGVTISVKFTYANTYNGTATMNVNSTGAKNIGYISGNNTSRYFWNANAIIDFTYDGTQWVMHRSGQATTTYYGITKLTSSLTSTSTTLAATASAVKSLNDTKLTNQTQQVVYSGTFPSLGLGVTNSFDNGMTVFGVYKILLIKINSLPVSPSGSYLDCEIIIPADYVKSLGTSGTYTAYVDLAMSDRGPYTIQMRYKSDSSFGINISEYTGVNDASFVIIGLI